MIIKKASFVISNTNYKLCPNERKAEYAFIGRSNVGKSSLINALTNIKSLAKTSGKPGKTQLINHFLINEDWYMVDLPGYGYAKTSKVLRVRFHKMINDYLLNRKNLICLFVLIDSRHNLQSIDNEFMQFLSGNNIPFTMVFTKIDKQGKSTLKNNFHKFKTTMLNDWETLPKHFMTSSVKRTGLKELLSYISELNTGFQSSQES
ncbi:ribosome biogenesis GTP-binding protein YihA/YsxC [Flavobacteriales bacterium]|nr:ribosome biogenesis GTP-binding protein YihA/YsxC [Flavobacteriales bacterium]MDC1024941.1 ribosome biogenesis GTP-binding protein YihA/YsxC [Flavobacteriales bacterium]